MTSATDQLLNELKKIYTGPQTHNLINDAITMSLKVVVLNIVHGPRWDETMPTAELPKSEPTPAAEDILPLVSEEGSNNDIISNVKLLTSGAMTTIEFELKEQIVNNTLSEEVVKSYLEKIEIKPVKDKKKNVEKFKNWLDVDASKRPYILWNKTRLVDPCVGKFAGKKYIYNSYESNNLTHMLATYQGHPSAHHQTSHNQTSPAASDVHTLFLSRIFQSTSMPRLKAKGREYCKIGNALKLPFARKLLQHSKEGLTKFEVERVYRVGLVSRRGRPSAKASCDFVAVANINGERLLVGVECKARLTPATQQQRISFPLPQHKSHK
jgi:hypothetical protein